MRGRRVAYLPDPVQAVFCEAASPHKISWNEGQRGGVRGLAIPKYSRGPGVIVEVAFINSKVDRDLVRQNAHQIGRDIANGIINYTKGGK